MVHSRCGSTVNIHVTETQDSVKTPRDHRPGDRSRSFLVVVNSQIRQNTKRVESDGASFWSGPRGCFHVAPRSNTEHPSNRHWTQQRRNKARHVMVQYVLVTKCNVLFPSVSTWLLVLFKPHCHLLNPVLIVMVTDKTHNSQVSTR